jgi:hypothetical protein
MDHLGDLNFPCQLVWVRSSLCSHHSGVLPIGTSRWVFVFSSHNRVPIYPVCIHNTWFQSMWINNLDANAAILGNTLLVFFFSVISVSINVICLPWCYTAWWARSQHLHHHMFRMYLFIHQPCGENTSVPFHDPFLCAAYVISMRLGQVFLDVWCSNLELL